MGNRSHSFRHPKIGENLISVARCNLDELTEIVALNDILTVDRNSVVKALQVLNVNSTANSSYLVRLI